MKISEIFVSSTAWILGKLLQFVGFLIYWTPFKLKRTVARALAWKWFYLLQFRRRIMLLNVAMVFPRRKEESNQAYQTRCEVVVRQNMEHVLLMLLELLERFYWTEDTVSRKIRWHFYEHLKPLLDSKKGFFFLSAHLGNWELLTRAGCAIGVPLTVITRFLRNPIFDRIWVQSRRRFGLELLSETGSGLAVIRTVQRGRALGFIADQHTGEPHGMEAQFLGHKAWCPKALALMADRLQAPILPAFIIRDPETGEHHVHFEEPLEFPLLAEGAPEAAQLRSGSGGLSPAGIKYHIEVCNAVQEKWIRRYPEQYLWMHKRFKNLIDYRKEALPWEL
jgi:KDO2-lipid IV(A) lauroyltransferase